MPSLLVLAAVTRFCSSSRTSCRKSAASRSSGEPGARAAASTTKIMPRRCEGVAREDSAWCRSLPCPGVSASRKRLCVCKVGSCADRYWVEAAVVVMGRETSTVRGACEVWVWAGAPRSSWDLLVVGFGRMVVMGAVGGR